MSPVSACAGRPFGLEKNDCVCTTKRHAVTANSVAPFKSPDIHFEARPTTVSISHENSSTASTRQSTMLTAMRRSASPVAMPGMSPPTIMPMKTIDSGRRKRKSSRTKAATRNTTQNDEIDRTGSTVAWLVQCVTSAGE